jgi:hypothetical protein
LTNLSQAPYSLIAALFSEVFNEMSRQGVSVEQIEALLSAPKQLHEWIGLVPEVTPSTDNTPIVELFPGDQRLANLLFREDIKTLAELTDCTVDEVRNIWQLGEGAFAKITAVLEAQGLRFSEHIENGARRIPYGSPYDKRTVRRDRLGGKRISDFIRIEKDNSRNQRDREGMTIDEYRTADTDTHRRLFSDAEIHQISTWIVTNVR